MSGTRGPRKPEWAKVANLAKEFPQSELRAKVGSAHRAPEDLMVNAAEFILRLAANPLTRETTLRGGPHELGDRT